MKENIPMTVRAPRDLYKEFHSIAHAQAATHNAIMVRMMEMYVKSGGNLLDLEKIQPKIIVRITARARRQA